MWDDDDLDRVLDSRDALPEMTQEYEEPMVIVGTDVISLYPNMEVERVVENIKEAVRTSKLEFKGVDYLERVRYLALNWDAETCRKSNLRRVLPTRRGRRGSRPSIISPGPRGRLRGDQEQWIFPDVVLEEWEKREILAEVVGLAVQAMFGNHYYEFGGSKFHQAQGGPIGLRGTCAVARVILQLFDSKWTKRLEECRIVTWLVMRYVDDCRALLPPIRSGWRWLDGGLKYTKRWEEEDRGVSGEERTKEIIKKSMTGIEEYLQFTAESGMEFHEGWLPTLDTSLKVSRTNKVKYRFYEKETTTRYTVQKDSAMEENVKVQILAQDMVRRLNNSSEDLGMVQRKRLVDNYAQKLLNSGYAVAQVRRIIVSGIKGF